jgi:hypothetical protein
MQEAFRQTAVGPPVDIDAANLNSLLAGPPIPGRSHVRGRRRIVNA